MRDPKSNIRYVGFQALSNGSRRFDFSFTQADGSLHMISVEAGRTFFSGPDQVALQECAGICYETLKCQVAGHSDRLPRSVSLTAADVAQHRKVGKVRGRA